MVAKENYRDHHVISGKQCVCQRLQTGQTCARQTMVVPNVAKKKKSLNVMHNSTFEKTNCEHFQLTHDDGK